MSAAALALPDRPDERAELFATCSGRLDALATRQRARLEPDAGDSDRLRAEFEMLLDAVMPMAQEAGVVEVQARSWRHRGWREVAYLMATADYNPDRTKAAWAWHDMTLQISDCRKVLL